MTIDKEDVGMYLALNASLIVIGGELQQVVACLVELVPDHQRAELLTRLRVGAETVAGNVALLNRTLEGVMGRKRNAEEEARTSETASPGPDSFLITDIQAGGAEESKTAEVPSEGTPATDGVRAVGVRRDDAGGPAAPGPAGGA